MFLVLFFFEIETMVSFTVHVGDTMPNKVFLFVLFRKGNEDFPYLLYIDLVGVNGAGADVSAVRR